MSSTTHTAQIDPLAALTAEEREALASLARERVANLAAIRANNERVAAWDAYYAERAAREVREAEERAADQEAAVAAARELPARPLRAGDDVLSLVRECADVIGRLPRGHLAHGDLAARAEMLAVLAHETGASELAAMEALRVLDRRTWQAVLSRNRDVRQVEEFAEFIRANDAAAEETQANA